MSPCVRADETTMRSTRPSKNSRLVVGLTGGIGSGKSTVAELFGQLGASIIDTDAISHQLTGSGGGAIPALRATFGERYIDDDGALDRTEMRALIFNDADARLRLEQLLHPLILAETESRLSQEIASPYCILVIPLLPQAPAFRRLVQRILVVDCDERHQIERVQRRGLSEAMIRTIISSQTPRAERLKLADDIIINEGDMSSLFAQVTALHQRYLENSD